MFGNTFNATGPVNDYGKIVTIAHMFFAALLMAVGTGTVFVKLSKATTSLVYAKHVVVGNPDGIRTLTFRIANRRSNMLVDIVLKATLITDHTTSEGEIYERTQPLNFDEPPSVICGDTTLRHRLDEASPLYAMTSESIRRKHMRIALVFSAHEETFNDCVCAFYMYAPEHILFNHRFARMRERNPEGSETVFTVHMNRLNNVVPCGVNPICNCSACICNRSNIFDC